MIEEIKELFQNLIAPQLEGIKGDIRALDVKMDAKFETVDAKIATVLAKVESVDSKVESFRRELLSEIRRVEEKFELRLEARTESRIVQ